MPSRWRTPDFRTPPLPIVPVDFDKDGLALSYFSTVTTLGTPQDAMSQEIRLESFFPADEATTTHAHRQAVQGRWPGPRSLPS